MKCPRCGSTNVNAQIVSETKVKYAKRDFGHGCLWWIVIGWWWMLIKWCLFFPITFLIGLFSRKHDQLKTKHKSMFICQQCGHSWKKF